MLNVSIMTSCPAWCVTKASILQLLLYYCVCARCHNTMGWFRRCLALELPRLQITRFLGHQYRIAKKKKRMGGGGRTLVLGVLLSPKDSALMTRFRFKLNPMNCKSNAVPFEQLTKAMIYVIHVWAIWRTLCQVLSPQPTCCTVCAIWLKL